MDMQANFYVSLDTGLYRSLDLGLEDSEAFSIFCVCGQKAKGLLGLYKCAGLSLMHHFH